LDDGQQTINRFVVHRQLLIVKKVYHVNS
jgi:hypothetical protein